MAFHLAAMARIARNNASNVDECDDESDDLEQLSTNDGIKELIHDLSNNVKGLSAKNKELLQENKRLKEMLSRSSKSSPARSHRPPAVLCHEISPAVTPNDILLAGLLYAGYEPAKLQKNNSKRKIGWFKSFYGVEPTTVAPYFLDIKEKYPDIKYKDCLLTMNWAYLYDTQPVLSARWKYCEEYIADKVIAYGMKMAKVGMMKITYELKHKVKLGRTVDCSTFMCFEMRLDPSTEWFDYKTHSEIVKSKVNFSTFAK